LDQLETRLKQRGEIFADYVGALSQTVYSNPRMSLKG